MKKIVILLLVVAATSFAYAQNTKKVIVLGTLPKVMTNYQLVEKVYSFEKIPIYVEGKRYEFAIVKPSSGIAGVSYLYKRQGESWVQIPMPITNASSIDGVTGFAHENAVWVGTTLLGEKITKTYRYSLDTGKFEELASYKK